MHLVERILDRHDGEFIAEALVHRSQLLARNDHRGVGLLVLEVEVVFSVLVELRCCHVHADFDLAGIASLLDGLNKEREALLVVLDVGREATFVANVARVLQAVVLG